MGNLADKLRVGILGTARIAETRMIPPMKRSGLVNVTAVAGRDLNRTKAFALNNGIPRFFGSYLELIEDEQIDAVYIALPISMHREWSLLAIEAGKHVLCEKALSSKAAHILPMYQAARKRGVILWEALYYKYHPLHQRVISLIHEGHIGELRSVYSTFCTNPAPDNIRRYKSTGGGVLLDTGSYCVSISRWITGEEPVGVSARAQYSDQGVEEDFSGILEFPTGVFGQFYCSLNSAFHCAYEVYGSEGRIVVDYGGMCAWPGESFTIKLTSRGESSEIMIPPSDPYLAMIEDFARAVEQNDGQKTNIEDAHANLLVIEQLLKESEKSPIG